MAIAEGLESRGFKCWIAPRDVKAGRAYGDEIIRGIQGAKAFVLVLSEASNESAFVAREVERAVSKKKPVFAVRVAEVEHGPALELFVASTQWIDAFQGRLGSHLDRLAELLAEEEGREPAHVVPPPKTPRRIPKWALAAGALVLALAILGGAAFLRPGGDANLSANLHADYQTCETGSGTSAIDACSRAISSSQYSGRQLSFLYNDRGYLRMMSGDLDGGLTDLDEAIRIDPYGPYAYWNRAEVYRYKGDLVSAKADYERALSLGPRPEDRPKIEAALRALGTSPQQEKSDPFVISDPARFTGEQEGNASAAGSYPAEPAPAYPAEAAPPANGAPTNGSAPSMDGAPNSSHGPAGEPMQ